jgi:hypothetical protein
VAEQKVQEDLATKGNNTLTAKPASSSKSEELTKHLEDVVKKALSAVKESQDEENSKIDTLMQK